MTSDQQVGRRKLAHDIRERLLALIQERALAPGDFLPSERELMRSEGVGRPAIREAMQSLQAMGLVEIRHGGRARVAEPSLGRMVDQMGETMRHLLAHSPASLEHLKEARIVLEAEMARVAARKRSEGDLQRLRRLVSDQDAARAEPRRFLSYDGDFHREIAAIGANPIFSALVEATFRWLADFHVSAVRVPGLEDLTLDEHRQILAAIEAGDAEGAAAAMTGHLNRANDLYRQHHLEDRRPGSKPVTHGDPAAGTGAPDSELV